MFSCRVEANHIIDDRREYKGESDLSRQISDDFTENIAADPIEVAVTLMIQDRPFTRDSVNQTLNWGEDLGNREEDQSTLPALSPILISWQAEEDQSKKEALNDALKCLDTEGHRIS